MRVLHVARFFHPAVGGTENVIAHLADALGREGIESAVLVSDRRRDEHGPPPRVPVLVVPVVGSNRFPLPVGRLRQVVRAIREADVIHVHDVRFLFEVARLLAWVLRRPLIVSTHGLMFHTEFLGGTKRWLWKHYYARALRGAAHVVAASERDAALCRDVGIVDNLTVIHNPVRTAPFAQARLDLPRDPHRLLTFGRIAPEKSLDRLVAVMEAAPAAWRLRIAGTGDERDVDALRARLAPLGDRVELVGYKTDEDLAAELSECACVVLPSRQEAFGLTLVEAMTSGAPIVASDIAAYRELADSAGVAFADFDDPQAVVRAVESVAADHDPHRQRDRGKALSGEGAAEAHLRVYERAVRSVDPPAGRHRILGVDVEALDLAGVLGAVEEAVTARSPTSNSPAVIANHNLHSAALHRHDRRLREFYRRADRVFIDGVPLVWFGRLLGHELTGRHRTTWIDLIDPLADQIAERGWRLMIVGGTTEVVELGGAELRARHPTLDVTIRSGHFDATPGSADNAKVLAQISACRPHVLLVGMGMPRQEHWIDAHRAELTCSVVLNVGGLLDYLAGVKATPPRWLAARGFEWLARLATEPRRLAHRYLVEPWGLVPVAVAELVASVPRRLARRR